MCKRVNSTKARKRIADKAGVTMYRGRSRRDSDTLAESRTLFMCGATVPLAPSIGGSRN